ncbi:MAG: hypothetical protein JHD15_07125 [Phenylobacterium sp.]|uniref:hypothetical protein n=1 Tax=Phenylobacterium sp. TaxID=1871053 RepID=UPI001A279C32|nr:hypothetical protein [Phenylobacterium sp.]MBJ7410125.1 hypothetical protein [Phenylobacterium sp.]
MPALPIGTAAFERSEAPRVVLRNYYYEKSPANLEDQVSLIPRPRLKQFALCGAGPMRGLYRKGGVLANVGLSGSIIALSGDKLYRVTQTGLPGVGTATLIGTVAGTLKMTAEGDANVIVLCCGTTLYSTDGNTLTALTMPPGFSAYAVDTLSQRFLICSDIGRFYWTAVGATTISALDYATAESQPDVLLTLKVIGDELWLFGRLSIEVWQPTGDADLPFQRIGGRVFGIGITGRETCQKLNVGGADTVCWVGTDRRVYRTNPNPTRISDHGLEERLQRITDPTSLYAAVWNWNGHDFYVLHIPGEGSWAYDLGTGQWDEVTSFGRSLFRTAVSAVGPNSQPLLGDDTAGVIWEMTETERGDGDEPVLFECTGLLEVPEGGVRLDNVSLDVSTGLNPDPEADPVMQMAMSDDQGMTYGPDITQPLGRQGRRENVVTWQRLGRLKRPGKVVRWRTTEPVTIRKAKYNAAVR